MTDLSTFDGGISGGSAGINNARWFTCSLCGACVVDRENSQYNPEQNRKLHSDWHNLNDESTILEEITPLSASSLMVNIEFMELVEQHGEPEAWIILGKLKDLLG